MGAVVPSMLVSSLLVVGTRSAGWVVLQVEAEEAVGPLVGRILVAFLLVVGFSGSAYACTSALYLLACLSLMCLFAVLALA